jgi:poly-gamma-glutamate synthesis protein (capsule biosynthesis protein)
VLYVIISFLDWQQVSFASLSAGINEWHGVGVIAALLAIALLVWEGARLAGVRVALGPITPDAVRAARAELGADFVVVSVHWGTEFEAHPAPGQIEAAHLLVDAGADLVLGHHPHVLQDIERYHGGVIAYSLGNFVFDEGFLSRRQTIVRPPPRSRKRKPLSRSF